MGRIIALVLAVAGGVAGYFIGQNLWADNELAVVWTKGLQPDGTSIEWRQLYALVGAVGVWVLALNFLWPRN